MDLFRGTFPFGELWDKHDPQMGFRLLDDFGYGIRKTICIGFRVFKLQAFALIEDNRTGGAPKRKGYYIDALIKYRGILL